MYRLTRFFELLNYYWRVRRWHFTSAFTQARARAWGEK
jgi:hypothetical protein